MGPYASLEMFYVPLIMSNTATSFLNLLPTAEVHLQSFLLAGQHNAAQHLRTLAYEQSKQAAEFRRQCNGCAFKVSNLHVTNRVKVVVLLPPDDYS